MKVRDITFIGVAAAIICVFAPWEIPIGAIPITLATFAIYFTAAILGAYRGTVAVAVYVLLGTVGLPVFSGFVGGADKVVGVTGGYIIGYIPLALIVGLFADKMKSPAKYPIGMILGTAVLYAFGTTWYCVSASVALVPALAACVLPFIGFDLIKIAASSVIAVKAAPALRSISNFREKS